MTFKLRYGLKFGLVKKPKNSDMIVTAENIWDKYKKRLPNAYIKQEKIENSIRAMTMNILEFDDKRLQIDSRRINKLKNMKPKYATLKLN